MSALLTYAGWMGLLVAIETSALACVLAAWRAWRPAAAPETQHRAGVGALVACLLVVPLTPFALRSGAIRFAPAPMATSAQPPAAHPVRDLAPHARPVGGDRANAVVRIVGIVWLLATALMLVRLVGGWIVVRRLATDAREVTAGSLHTLAARVHATMGIRTPVRVAESTAIDVPIIVGLQPTLLVPPCLVDSRSLEPLLAHEFAHVERHDYLMNLLQSAVDALLALCPGVWWISACVRETREYCCDEIAARVCGDRRAYVEALAGIASLNAARQPAAALGVGGPRVATRIRRLLHDVHTLRYRRIRIAASVVAMILAVIATDRGAGLAASHLPQTPVSDRLAVEGSRTFQITTAWAMEQPGSAVVIVRGMSLREFACDTAVVRNDANVNVSSLTFVAVAEKWKDGPVGVETFTSPVIPVTLAPGSSTEVQVRLFSAAAELPRLSRTTSASKVQVMCGLARVEYANGFSWEVTPNPAARTADVALNLPPAELSRNRLVAAPQHAFECYDDRGAGYSPGAVVPIRNEPGTFAECVGGRWTESSTVGLGRSPALSPRGDRKLNMSFTGASLEEVLAFLSRTTGVLIEREDSVPPVNGLTVTVKDASLEQALVQILTGTGCTYRVVGSSHVVIVGRR